MEEILFPFCSPINRFFFPVYSRDSAGFQTLTRWIAANMKRLPSFSSFDIRTVQHNIFMDSSNLVVSVREHVRLIDPTRVIPSLTLRGVVTLALAAQNSRRRSGALWKLTTEALNLRYRSSCARPNFELSGTQGERFRG